MNTYNSLDQRELLRQAEEAMQYCTAVELEARERALRCERTIAEYGVNSTSARNDAGRARNAFDVAEKAAQRAEEAYIAYYKAVYGARKEYSAGRKVYYSELAKP